MARAGSVAIAAGVLSAQLATSIPAAAQDGGYKIEALWPATVTDVFAALWCDGLEQAAKDFGPSGITAECITAAATGNYTTPKYVDAINASTAKNTDAIIIFALDPPGIKDAVEAYQATGGKVIISNTVSDPADPTKDIAALGALGFVGSNVYDEGYAMGDCLIKAGSKNVLINNWGPGNPANEGRMQGARDAITAGGGKFSEIPLDYNNADNAKNQMIAALQSDPTIDGFTNGGSSNYGLETAGIGALDLFGKVLISNADPSVQTAEELQKGNIVCITSQQGFLQGYQSTALLALNLLYGSSMGGKAIFATGPYVVDASNIEALLPLIQGAGF